MEKDEIGTTFGESEKELIGKIQQDKSPSPNIEIKETKEAKKYIWNTNKGEWERGEIQKEEKDVGTQAILPSHNIESKKRDKKKKNVIEALGGEGGHRKSSKQKKKIYA